MKKLWNLKITPYKSGQLAEFVCRLYMRLHGYRIIAKNYKCGSGKKTSCGELDFVAAKGKRIVFCEVKKRKGLLIFSTRYHINNSSGLCVAENTL